MIRNRAEKTLHELAEHNTVLVVYLYLPYRLMHSLGSFIVICRAKARDTGPGADFGPPYISTLSSRLPLSTLVGYSVDGS